MFVAVDLVLVYLSDILCRLALEVHFCQGSGRTRCREDECRFANEVFRDLET
jgi:hypothetical protein